MRTEEERHENVRHECKTCGVKWTVRMRLLGGCSLTLPTYIGSDTYICPECKSQNTIMFTNRPKVEQG